MESQDEYDPSPMLVILNEPRILGVVLELGSFASLIWYTEGGISYQEWMENSEFTIVNEEQE